MPGTPRRANAASQPGRARPIWRCPLCDQPMEAVGFCHLVCPAGHYQEVCSDLFPADDVVPDAPPDPGTRARNTPKNTLQ